MPDINWLAVLVAAIVVFVLSSVYYILLGTLWSNVSANARPGERPQPAKVALELVRSLIVAAVVAGLANKSGIDHLGSGLLLGLALWVGFPFVLWTGAIIWENTPWKLAAIHAGDWFLKLLVIAAIVSSWR